MDEEQVLVIPRSVFDAFGAFQGIRFGAESLLTTAFQAGSTRYLPRSLAEEDPSYKQLIPYLLLTHGGRVLHYARGKGGGEARLASKCSIGIGGHINNTDHSDGVFDQAAYDRAVSRELHEELIVGNHSHRPMALLNDDSNEVGAVHLGVIHVVQLDVAEVAPNEAVIKNLEFLTPDEIRANRERLETWSQICADELETLLED